MANIPSNVTPPAVNWRECGTAKDKQNWTHWIWTYQDEQGPVFRVTNNAIGPYSNIGYRNLDALLKQLNLTKEKVGPPQESLFPELVVSR